jgi:hypothetical protein
MSASISGAQISERQRARADKAFARAEKAAARISAVRQASQYIVVSGKKDNDGRAISDLEVKVNAHLRQGWRLKGGVSVLENDMDGHVYGYQALTREVVPSANLLGDEEALLGMPAATEGLAELFPSGAAVVGGAGDGGAKAPTRKRSRRSTMKRNTRRRKN